MAILGIESLVYGVDDIDRCSRFWNDFGLLEKARGLNGSVFETVSGSRVIVRDRADCGVPEWFEGDGGKLVVWGVDTADNLERLVDGLARDREVRRDLDGTAYSATDEGIPFGLRIWNKRPVVSQPDRVNAPGNIQRLNLHRKWRRRAIPKTLSHIVLSTADYVGTYEFYRDRLGFRLSDHSRGLGVFMRADGTNEHHSIFWLNANGPFVKGKPTFQHAAFGVEDIDEVMIGVGRMGERGWFKDLRKAGGGSGAIASPPPSIATSPIRMVARPNTPATRIISTTTGFPVCGSGSSEPPCGPTIGLRSMDRWMIIGTCSSIRMGNRSRNIARKSV